MILLPFLMPHTTIFVTNTLGGGRNDRKQNRRCASDPRIITAAELNSQAGSQTREFPSKGVGYRLGVFKLSARQAKQNGRWGRWSQEAAVAGPEGGAGEGHSRWE